MALTQTPHSSIPVSPNLSAFRAKSRNGRRNAVPELDGKELATAGASLVDLEEKFKQMDATPSASEDGSSSAQGSASGKIYVESVFWK
jgi:hypothetical protein